MKYYIDCEFDGFKGPLLSMALVREDGESIYLVWPHAVEEAKDEWVRRHVVPKMWDIPSPLPGMAHTKNFGSAISNFMGDDSAIHIIADWPDDIRYFCETILTGPGMMIALPTLNFSVVRVDAYPTTLKGAVQHNAWWDAMALRELYR